MNKYALDYYPHEIKNNKNITFSFNLLDSANGEFLMQLQDNNFIFDLATKNKRFAINEMSVKTTISNSVYMLNVTEIPIFHNNDTCLSLLESKPIIIEKSYSVNYDIYSIKMSVIKEEFLKILSQYNKKEKTLIYIDRKLMILKHKDPIKFLETEPKDIFNFENNKIKERMNVIIYAKEYKEDIYV